MRAPPSSRSSLPRRGPWIALLSVVLIGAMPFLVCPRLERAHAEARGEEALAALAACLGAPLDDATLRGRRITAQLRGEDWPTRCREPATRLEVALATLDSQATRRCQGRCCPDDPRCQTTTEARDALTRLRASLEGRRFEGDDALALFRAASVLLTASAPSATEVPPVTTPPRPDPEAALARGGHDVAAVVPDTDGHWQLLLHARDKHAVVCDVDVAAASARCAPLPASIPIADSVLLVDGVPEAPLTVLAREDDAVAPERWAIYDATTGARKLALDHDALGATASRDGATAALIHDGAGYFIVAERGAPLSVDAGASGPPLLLGPWLVTAHQDAARTEIRARALTWQGRRPSLGEAEIIAHVASWPPTSVTIQGCRSGSTTTVAVTPDPPQPQTEVLVALHDGRSWSGETVGVDDPWFGLACDAAGATLTDIAEREASKVADGLRGRYVITRRRCTPNGCQRQRGTVEVTRWRAASRYLATSIGESMVMIWRSGLGDVRLVAAPPAALESTAPRSAFEGDEHGGYHFDRHGAELLARDGWALLVVAHEHAGDVGTHGLVVAPDGSVRALAVER